MRLDWIHWVVVGGWVHGWVGVRGEDLTMVRNQTAKRTQSVKKKVWCAIAPGVLREVAQI